MFCFFSFKVFPPPLLEYLNPKHMQCTVLSLSFSSLASFCLSLKCARRERERTHTELKKKRKEDEEQRRKDYYGARLLISTRRERTHTRGSFLRKAFYIYKYLSRESFCFPAKRVDFFPFLCIIPGRRASETSLSLSATTTRRTRNRSHQRPNLRPRTIGTTQPRTTVRR